MLKDLVVGSDAYPDDLSGERYPESGKGSTPVLEGASGFETSREKYWCDVVSDDAVLVASALEAGALGDE